MQRLLLLLTAALMLGGCNMVYAENEIFTQADAAGAPQMRPGLWVQRKSDCNFDETKPVKDWPECADPSLVTATTVGDLDEPTKQSAYVLASGDPRVLQVAVKLDPDKPTIWIFAGLKPLKTDAQGRIIEARTWMVQCGPPPPKKPDTPADADAADAAAAPVDGAAEPTADSIQADVDRQMAESVTREPLPGLTVKNGMCTATEREPVRNAAAASLAWDEDPPSVIHWVRDR